MVDKKVRAFWSSLCSTNCWIIRWRLCRIVRSISSRSTIIVVVVPSVVHCWLVLGKRLVMRRYSGHSVMAFQRKRRRGQLGWRKSKITQRGKQKLSNKIVFICAKTLQLHSTWLELEKQLSLRWFIVCYLTFKFTLLLLFRRIGKSDNHALGEVCAQNRIVQCLNCWLCF